MPRAPRIIPLLVFQALILFVLGTAQVAGGMTAERDEGVIDYQRLIPMSPLSKVLGYLFGLPVREYVMFLATLPFTAWALWRGEVAWASGCRSMPLFITSTLLYHFTGLVTGTVVRNRRWAFLVSIGLVFCLYTVIPQMAKFGLVFFKYLTITPVFQESLPGILPKTAGSIVATGQKLAPEVKFFNLDFSEAVFTVFSQGGLILTFVVMLCRKWRRTESHLLGKIWATGFFIWMQILLLGNALPLIEPGNLFPSREFSRRVLDWSGWAPKAGEAVAMSGIYGSSRCCCCSPDEHHHAIRGNPDPRLAARPQGRSARRCRSCRMRPRRSAGSSSWRSPAPAAGFCSPGRWWNRAGSRATRCRCKALGFFAVVMLSGGLGFQALLEAKGGRVVGLVVIFVGIVPLMIGAVLSATNNAS